MCVIQPAQESIPYLSGAERELNAHRLAVHPDTAPKETDVQLTKQTRQEQKKKQNAGADTIKIISRRHSRTEEGTTTPPKK